MRILLLVGGIVLTALTLFVGAMSIRHLGRTKHQLLNLAAYLGGSAALSFALHATFFILPEWLAERRSISRRRRHEESRQRRAPAPRDPRSRSGVAMVLALAAVALIGFLLMAMHRNQQRLSAQTRRQVERIQLREAATTAAHAALQRLADDPDLQVDHTNEPWAATERVEQPDGVITTTRVSDQQARFDVNNLAATRYPSNRTPEAVLADVFTVCGHFATGSYLRELGAWMRPGSDAQVAAGHPLDTIADLAHVPGFEPVYLERKSRLERRGGFDGTLVDRITALPVQRNDLIPVNVNTAHADTLRGVLGLEREDLVRAIELLRLEKPIRSIEVLGSLDTDPRLSRIWRPYTAVRSEWFVIHAEARQNERTERVEALAHRSAKGDVRVVQWWF